MVCDLLEKYKFKTLIYHKKHKNYLTKEKARLFTESRYRNSIITMVGSTTSVLLTPYLSQVIVWNFVRALS